MDCRDGPMVGDKQTEKKIDVQTDKTEGQRDR